MRTAATEAGRDADAIEISGSSPTVLAGGEAAVDEIGRLAELGVSRLIIPPLAFDPAAIGDALAAFGADVIAKAP